MKGFELLLTLREDCVFSERSATEGGHRGLDYVPGAALLGAFAARLYPDKHLSPQDKFELFHSGRVRFGNGLPLGDTGATGWPMPLCWHRDKGATWETVDHRLRTDAVFYLSAEAAQQRDKQPEQLRGGYVTASGQVLKPNKALRLKTAINPHTGRAREAALFGYDALRAGARFSATVQVDDTVPDALLEALRTALPEVIPLGRSRSAEYGSVEVSVQPLPADDARPPEQAKPWGDQRDAAPGERIALWLLSDLAAADPDGQPSLNPEPQWLGLPPGRLHLGASFLRSRRYSPWNAHRGGPDLERQVLCQGSLLVFDLDAPLPADERRRLAGAALPGPGLGCALGLHREAGLGRVWLNPPLLGHPGTADDLRPKLMPEAALAQTTPSDDEAPKTAATDLSNWLKAGLKHGTRRDESAVRALKLADGYPAMLRSARRLHGLPEGAEIGPSHSQWGAVLALAKRPPEDFAKRLFDLENGPCKPKAPGWRDEYWEQAGPRSFAAWLRDALGETPEPEHVQRLAREIMHNIKREVRR